MINSDAAAVDSFDCFKFGVPELDALSIPASKVIRIAGTAGSGKAALLNYFLYHNIVEGRRKVISLQRTSFTEVQLHIKMICLHLYLKWGAQIPYYRVWEGILREEEKRLFDMARKDYTELYSDKFKIITLDEEANGDILWRLLSAKYSDTIVSVSDIETFTSLLNAPNGVHNYQYARTQLMEHVIGWGKQYNIGLIFTEQTGPDSSRRLASGEDLSFLWVRTKQYEGTNEEYRMKIIFSSDSALHPDLPDIYVTFDFSIPSIVKTF